MLFSLWQVYHLLTESTAPLGSWPGSVLYIPFPCDDGTLLDLSGFMSGIHENPGKDGPLRPPGPIIALMVRHSVCTRAQQEGEATVHIGQRLQAARVSRI